MYQGYGMLICSIVKIDHDDEDYLLNKTYLFYDVIQ